MRKSSIAASLALSVLAIATASAASAQTMSGDMRCRLAGGLGFIVGAQRAVSCVYYRADGVTEFYTGSSSRIGVDLGGSNAIRLSYRVAGADPTQPGALEGAFGGPGVGVTIGAGIGADALVGGRSGTAVLLPTDNSYVTGIDVSAGLSVLSLHYAGMESARDRRRR